MYLSVLLSLLRFCGFRKGPKLRSWVWWITQFVIALPCSHSYCYGWNRTVTIVPEGEIYVEYGKPLEIYCIAEGSYTSSDIRFTSGVTTFESEVVNATARRLYLTYAEKQVKTYYCRNSKSPKFCHSRVIVDSRPEDVTDFKCISHNFAELNCSFTTPTLVSSTNYSLSFSINDHTIDPPCVPKKIPDTNTRYCLWDTINTKPRYRQSEEILDFHLVAENYFGSNNQRFVIDHYSIVKPAPPLYLRMTANGSHSITLFWDLPNNVKDFLLCGVNHIIEYTAEIDHKTPFHYAIQAEPTKNGSSYSYDLNLPYANVPYEVRVYIKSVRAIEREFWSNFSSLVFTL